MNAPRETIRIDKWLWFARFFKSRGLSAKMIAAGHCRINSVKIAKGSVAVGAGDVITFPKEDDVRVIEVVAIGERRGPAVEAQTLYVDLSPPVKKEKGVYVPNPEAERSGRPNRQERDAMRKFKGE
ncbi:RNA-binding S4 domain-containing protein [Amylibacter sp. IMCC11727]|uniref:RNA-binding S4 domain-containing protein n=1 Tax=Amylibacter sp. IMCC11727 TaxID=3039851 RepID=UPI00244E21F3|nr:RNA-binding S4 domain-containing protein [Amylibacter sp. IMCC11727]WGI21128.1 RNA-binding S4 domain-containing protein [Amylibacter sp. IMCC11727]